MNSNVSNFLQKVKYMQDYEKLNITDPKGEGEKSFCDHHQKNMKIHPISLEEGLFHEFKTFKSKAVSL